MAVKTLCPRCKKTFSAPEDRLGQKVECPLCGNRSVLRSPEEIREMEEVQLERQKQLEEDQRRIEFIERMDLRRQRSSRPYYETYGIERRAVRHFNPNAPSRYLRCRALSDVFLLSAYVVLLLALLGMGLTIYLKLVGVIPGIALMVLCLSGWSLLGIVLFLGLKFAGELAYLFSDLGDQQRDLVQLLMDLRENTDSPLAHEEHEEHEV